MQGCQGLRMPCRMSPQVHTPQTYTYPLPLPHSCVRPRPGEQEAKTFHSRTRASGSQCRPMSPPSLTPNPATGGSMDDYLRDSVPIEKDVEGVSFFYDVLNYCCGQWLLLAMYSWLLLCPLDVFLLGRVLITVSLSPIITADGITNTKLNQC